MKLRALEPSDLDNLYLLENDTALWTDSDTTAPYSRDTLKTYILTSSNDFFLDRQLRLVIEVDGLCAGFVDLCNFSALHNRAEVCIALLPQFRGKGHGEEALRQLCSYASRFLHLHQVYAKVRTDNNSSNHAFQKAGFRLTATLTDWIHCSDGRYSNANVWQFDCDVPRV